MTPEILTQDPTFSLPVYLPDGTKLYYTTPTYADGREAARHMKALVADFLESGLLMSPPGLEAGEEKELIVVVMRRAKPSDNTPIIDFYPAWGAGGDEPFGTYKYIHMYLNTPDDIAAFLSASGFKSLDDIPLYDGRAPLKRTSGKSHAKETTVPTPFYIVRKPGNEKTGSDGKPYRPWEFVAYQPANPSPTTGKPASEPPPEKITGDPEPPWNADTVKVLCKTFGQQVVWDALGIQERASEWSGGYNAAVVKIQAKAAEAAF